jgi:hypothetical protein
MAKPLPEETIEKITAFIRSEKAYHMSSRKLVELINENIGIKVSQPTAGRLRKLAVKPNRVAANDPNRNADGTFAKGNAASVHVPEFKEIQDQLRDFVGRKGIKLLKGLAEDSKDGKNQRAAIELMMNYAYGKPTQGVELTGKNGGPVQVQTWLDLLVLAEEADKSDAAKGSQTD